MFNLQLGFDPFDEITKQARNLGDRRVVGAKLSRR
jgi:hypothetical protein